EGILARGPRAGGLLRGNPRPDWPSAENAHRRFNREGASFDKGETFSGVPYEVGLEAVESLRRLVPKGASLSQLALRWILMFDAVGCAIPGARTDAQGRGTCVAADLPVLDAVGYARVR